jgi:hypothetical protein
MRSDWQSDPTYILGWSSDETQRLMRQSDLVERHTRHMLTDAGMGRWGTGIRHYTSAFADGRGLHSWQVRTGARLSHSVNGDCTHSSGVGLCERAHCIS